MICSIILFVVSTILTIALAPRPPTPKAATLTDFVLPTADQGRNIPVIFGTCNITGSNCVWYGDLSVVPVRIHTLFSSNVTGFQYYLGFQLVLGHGPFDSINKVYWDKKLTWRGDQNGNPITASGRICMSWLNLFGGRKTGGGGVQGCFDLIMGTDAEPQNPYLAQVLGNAPNFRGVTSMVWIGGNSPASLTQLFTQDNFTISVDALAGMGYIGTQASVRGVEFEATRILNGWNIPSGCWYPEKAVITQSTVVTSAPTWSPTFEYSVFAHPLESGATAMNYDPTNTNFSAATQGYLNIGDEWIQCTSVQVGTSGTSLGSQTGAMNIIRGVFGTNGNVTYPVSTPYYFYETATGPVQAMNAAHIVYQCLTEPRWGLGLPVSCLDDVAFRAAADVFYGEGMGLCMQWINASSVQDFLKIVLDHCAANLVMVNATGLYSLVPIRGGYDASTLGTFDETSIKELTEFSTQGWADETNQVTLVYTDPGTRVDTAISGQDIANESMQGKIVGQTVHYGGIRDHVLAANVLGREMTSRCTPLIKIKIAVNRAAYAVNSAGLFKLNWAKRNVTGLIMRITSVEKGKLDDNVINIEAIQDIYSLGLYNYQISSSVSGGGTVPTKQLTQAQINSMLIPPPDQGPTVLSASQTAPPATPNDGDRYIVPAGATGVWADETGKVAIYDGPTSTWEFASIPAGVLVYNAGTQTYLTTDTSGTVIQSRVGTWPTAAQVTYNDVTVPPLGATDVQDAITALAVRTGSTDTGGSGGTGLTISDGTTTVDAVTGINVTGATVTTTGTGEATIDLSGGGGGGTGGGGSPLTVGDGSTSVDPVTSINFSGATVTRTGESSVSVNVSGGGGGGGTAGLNAPEALVLVSLRL